MKRSQQSKVKKKKKKKAFHVLFEQGSSFLPLFCMHAQLLFPPHLIFLLFYLLFFASFISSAYHVDFTLLFFFFVVAMSGFFKTMTRKGIFFFAFHKLLAEYIDDLLNLLRYFI